MALSSEPYSSRADNVTFLVCISLAVIVRLAPIQYTEALASGIRVTLLVPFLQLQVQTERWRIRRTEFVTIMAEHDSAVALVGQMQALNQENSRLRAILGLRSRMPVHHVAGEVLHQSLQGGGTTLIVSAGKRDGVVRWAPVVAVGASGPGGLVGNVQAVDQGTSVVHSWTHPDFAVSVTGLDDAVVGIASPSRGEGGSMMLELRGVSFRGNVPPGTAILTSGLGGVYPRGIPVGYVRGVIDEREGWSRSFLLAPAVHPATVSHALILLAQTGDLSAAFERP